MLLTGINYYKVAVEKDRDSNFTTITTIWKLGFKNLIMKKSYKVPPEIYGEIYLEIYRVEINIETKNRA
jgi:hypothetical protein